MHDPFGKTVVGELVIQMFFLWDIETHSKNTLRTEVDFKDSCGLKLVQEPVSHEEPKATLEIPSAPFPHGFFFL